MYINRKARKEAGLCTSCPNVATAGRTRCQNCHDKCCATYYKRIANGKCGTCDAPSQTPICLGCRNKKRLLRRVKRSKIQPSKYQRRGRKLIIQETGRRVSHEEVVCGLIGRQSVILADASMCACGVTIPREHKNGPIRTRCDKCLQKKRIAKAVERTDKTHFDPDCVKAKVIQQLATFGKMPFVTRSIVEAIGMDYVERDDRFLRFVAGVLREAGLRYGTRRLEGRDGYTKCWRTQ